MAYSAKHLKESLEQGTDMQDIERDDERVETHISGVRNLSEEAREMRAAGRKLVGEGEEKADNLSDYRRLSGSVKKLKESVDAQRAEVNQAVKKMDQTLYEMRNLVDRVEELYNSAKDETHSAEQAALNGVNKAQEKAQEITLRNIDEATQRSKKAIDTMFGVEAPHRAPCDGHPAGPHVPFPQVDGAHARAVHLGPYRLADVLVTRMCG